MFFLYHSFWRRFANGNLIFLIRWFLTATSGTKPIIVCDVHVYILLHQREKRGSTIQYGYRKRGTHARVFSLTLTHGNSKNEIRQWDRRRRREERREYGKKVQRARIKEVPTAYHYLIKTILINIKCYYFKRYGKNIMKFN